MGIFKALALKQKRKGELKTPDEAVATAPITPRMNPEEFYDRQVAWRQQKQKHVEAIRHVRKEVDDWKQFHEEEMRGTLTLPPRPEKVTMQYPFLPPQQPTHNAWIEEQKQKIANATPRNGSRLSQVSQLSAKSRANSRASNAASQRPGTGMSAATSATAMSKESWENYPRDGWIPSKLEAAQWHGKNMHKNIPGYSGFYPGKGCKETLLHYQDPADYNQKFESISANLTSVYGGVPRANPIPPAGDMIMTYSYNPTKAALVRNKVWDAHRKKNDMSEFVEADAKMRMLRAAKRDPKL
eukprot:GFYU01009452.1.p1 GENE.GFYU01009452.1~~GFYU01009452.1.p1  ORF type:complete len:298 (-),score=83.03 GFYU01009452.1:109-1002(-)